MLLLFINTNQLITWLSQSLSPSAWLSLSAPPLFFLLVSTPALPVGSATEVCCDSSLFPSWHLQEIIYTWPTLTSNSLFSRRHCFTVLSLFPPVLYAAVCVSPQLKLSRSNGLKRTNCQSQSGPASMRSLRVWNHMQVAGSMQKRSLTGDGTWLRMLGVSLSFKT